MVDNSRKTSDKSGPGPKLTEAPARPLSGALDLGFSDVFVGRPKNAPPASLKGAFDQALASARGWLPEGMDRGLATIPGQVVKPFAYVLNNDFGKPGDRQESEKLVERVDRYFDGAARKPKSAGQFDVAMAAGWHPKEPIKVNGVLTKLEKPIDNLLAVFVRNPDGSVEILDPSLKVHGVGEFLMKYPALPLLLDSKKPADKRWADTAGLFIESQVLPMVAGSAASAVTKVPALAQKTSLADTMNKVAKAGQYAGTAQFATIGASMAAEMHAHSVSKDAADRLADRLVDALHHPDRLTNKTLADAMNKGLHEYTFNRNTNNSIYIPSLDAKDDVWGRLSQVLQGRVDGFTKGQNPWQKWEKDRDVKVPDMSDKLEANPKFMSQYYGTAAKALNGKELSDSEYLILRVGMSVVSRSGYEIAGKEFSSGQIKYKNEERAAIVQSLRLNLGYNFVEDLGKHPDFSKVLGVDAKRAERDADYRDELQIRFSKAPVDDALLVAYATRNKGGFDQSLAQKASADQQKIKAQSMALSMPL